MMKALLSQALVNNATATNDKVELDGHLFKNYKFPYNLNVKGLAVHGAVEGTIREDGGFSFTAEGWVDDNQIKVDMNNVGGELHVHVVAAENKAETIALLNELVSQLAPYEV